MTKEERQEYTQQKKKQSQEKPKSEAQQVRDIIKANIVKPGGHGDPSVTPGWWTGKWTLDTYKKVQSANKAQQQWVMANIPALAALVGNTVSDLNTKSGSSAAKNPFGEQKQQSPAEQAAKAAQDSQRRLEYYAHSPAVQRRMQQQQQPVTYAQQNEQGELATPKPDETLQRLQREAEQTRQASEAASGSQPGEADQVSHDREIMDQDLRDINAMTPEERKTLTSYGNYLKLQRQDASSEMGPEPGEEPMIPREYQALVEKYGQSRLAELAESQTRAYNETQRQQVQQAAVRNSTGAGKAALATGLNLATFLPRGFVAAAGRIDEAKNSTGRYQSMAAYTPGDAMNLYAETARQNVAQQIAGDGDNLFRQGLATLYQVGTQAVEQVAGAIVLGPGAAAAAGAMNQYATTLSDASQKGATPGQAVLLATSNAALDYIMDKIPLDRLVGLAKTGSPSVLQAAFKQAGITMSTTGASFVGSQVLEMSILQENSDYQRNIQSYIAQGYDPNAATVQADKDLIMQAGQQMLVAGLSSGASALISTAVGNRRAAKAEEPPAEQSAGQDTELNAENTTPESQPMQEVVSEQPSTENQSPVQETPSDDRIAQIRASQEERDIAKEADRISYEDAKSRAKARKELEKTIAKTQEDVDAGIGSPARLRQLQARLSQMDMEDADYPRTRQEAIAQQVEVVDALSREQHNAYIQRETGEASNRPNKAATTRLKAAKQELDRLRRMSDADYADELSAMGLVGNTRAPWLNGASANLAAQGEQADETWRAMAQDTASQIRAAAEPQEVSTPAPVADLAEAADFLRGRLEQQQGDYARRSGSATTDPVSDAAENLVRSQSRQRQTAQDALQGVQDQVAAMTGQEQVEAVPPTVPPAGDTTGTQAAPSGDTRKSASFTNSGLGNEDPDIRAGYRQTLKQAPEAGDYNIKHNADTLSTAQARTATPEQVRQEYGYLMSKQDPFTAEDVVTARLVSKKLFQDGDVSATAEMNKRLAAAATNAGQVAQAFSIAGTMKDAANPQSAVESATARMMKLPLEDSAYTKRSGQTYEQWQNTVIQNITALGMAVDAVPEGDAAAMRDVITQIAQARKTTAWFGTSSKLTRSARKVLEKLEFDDLKRIADTQIAAMPDDFRKRSAGEVTGGLRKQAMLSSLKTFERNIAGNSAVGLLDSASDSFGGRLADTVLSKVTGKRTIGNDMAKVGTYLQAAKDAGSFASLCVELNIPIETDVNASFDSAVGANGSGKYIGKTFSATGNPVMRTLYAYQKYMSYALEVSDKIFEGGTNEAVSASLEGLRNANLSDEEIGRLADYTSNRRTFKDATWQDSSGGTNGAVLSRITQSFKNIAKGKGKLAENTIGGYLDANLPFASVPMNVAQTGIDYTTGVFKGLAEIGKIIQDSNRGIQIPVERQRQAASDFGRGLTGAALITLAAAAAKTGIIQVHDASDKDQKALEQSQGLSGAQINWSAMSRAADGSSDTAWKSGDLVTSLDFLEPFNTHMYLGVELANAETPEDYIKAPLISVWKSFMDSPMMDGLNESIDMASNVQKAFAAKNPRDAVNAVASYAGSVASSFIPQFVRQTAQATDGFYRDTRGADATESAVNSIKAAIPDLSQTLPKKIDGFGQEQQRLGPASTFLDPTNTQRLNLNETAQQVGALSEQTGDVNIYPDRQPPQVVKNAIGEDVRLTNEQRETYQREYGQRNMEYYTGLQQSQDFKSLPADQQAAALKKAEEYATQFARAAVTDYRETPSGNTADIVADVVTKTVSSAAESAMGDVSKAWEFGYNPASSKKALESVYQQMQKLSPAARESVYRKATGQTAKYLEARQSGIPDDKALSVLESVQSIPKESRQRTVYQLEAVSQTPGLRQSDMDKAMKLYLPDYDPESKTPNLAELRYDYIRNDLGYSARGYAAFRKAYDVADDDFGNQNGYTAKQEFYDAMEAAGYDRATASEIYTVLWGGSSRASKATRQRILELYG